MPSAALEEYRQFEKSMVSEVHDVEAVNRGVLTNKLLQFANGSMYREDKSVAPIHDEKLHALDEIVEDAHGDNLLVFYSFRFDLDRIKERYPYATVLNEEPDAVNLWNQKKIRMLLAHPASCAHGLNMQYGGHVSVWYGLTWSLELYLQANARLPRSGQTEQVLCHRILARGTNDESVLKVLKKRDAVQQDISDAVRTRILSHSA
jgi:SNF2 family DNA or RNA helicase